MHRGLRSGPRMGELFQGQDGSLWRSVGPLEVGAALAGRDEEEVYRDPCAAASAGLPLVLGLWVLDRRWQVSTARTTRLG